MMEQIILRNMNQPESRDHWASAYSAAMTFLHGGDDCLGEGRGLYGKHLALVYEYERADGPDIELAVWRDSAGVNVAPFEVDEG